MAKLDPRILRLRETTYHAVQTLIDSCTAKSERHALMLIYEKTTKNHKNSNNCQTGFIVSSFQQLYQQYKDFKRYHFHHNPPKHKIT